LKNINLRYSLLFALLLLPSLSLLAQYTGGKDDGYAMATWSSTSTISDELVKVHPTLLEAGTFPQFNILVEYRAKLNFQLVATNGQVLANGNFATTSQSTMQQLFKSLNMGAYFLRIDYKGKEQVVKLILF